MALADNTEALMGGFQIGNQWASARDRRKEHADNMAMRTDEAQARLKAGFGEDTVFDEKGKVDIVGSAGKQRIRKEAEAMAQAQGTINAYGDRILGAAPVAAPQQQVTPLEPGDPGFARQAGIQTGPTASDFAAQMGQGSTLPTVPVGGASAAMLPSPEDNPSGPPSVRYGAPVAGPVSDRSVGPTGFRMPTNGDEAIGFMHALPNAMADQRMREHYQQIAEQAKALAQQHAEDLKQSLAWKEKNAGMIDERAKKSRDLRAEMGRLSREASAEKGNQTDKRVRDLAQNKAPQLSVEDREATKELERDFQQKTRIADALDINIQQLSDPKNDEYVKRQVGLNILKTLNSAEGKDAVGAEEAKRIGQFLDFQMNPLIAPKTGRMFGTDMNRFMQQVALKRDELRQRAAQTQTKLDAIRTRTGGTAPAETGTPEPASGGTTEMIDPQGNVVQVPPDRLKWARENKYSEPAKK